MIQRGSDLASAQKKLEWMYFNIWHKDKHASTVRELAEMQNDTMDRRYNNLRIYERRSPKREDGRETYIRLAEFDELPCLEITGYIDCDDFITFFVLFTTKELESKNLRKLYHVLKYSTPYKIAFDNSRVIVQLESELDAISDRIERAAAFKQLADWYSEMDNSEKEMEYRRLCWDSHPETYENIIPLIAGELKMSNKNEAINYSVGFFSLAPENPRVMQDLLFIYGEPGYKESFLELIRCLKAKYHNQTEALGNICAHYAMYLSSNDEKEMAVDQFMLANELFTEIDENHYVIGQINEALSESALEERSDGRAL